QTVFFKTYENYIPSLHTYGYSPFNYKIAMIQQGEAGGTVGLNVPGKGGYANAAAGSAPIQTGYFKYGEHYVLHRYNIGHRLSRPNTPDAAFYQRSAAQDGGFGGGGGG